MRLLSHCRHQIYLNDADAAVDGFVGPMMGCSVASGGRHGMTVGVGLVEGDYLLYPFDLHFDFCFDYESASACPFD